MKEPKKYYWTDLESGITFECSKEYRDSILAIWESCRPKIDELNLKFGMPIITGTGGDIEKDEFKWFEDNHCFKNPEQPSKLLRKLKMEQKVVDDKNRVWGYTIDNKKPSYFLLHLIM